MCVFSYHHKIQINDDSKKSCCVWPMLLRAHLTLHIRKSISLIPSSFKFVCFFFLVYKIYTLYIHISKLSISLFHFGSRRRNGFFEKNLMKCHYSTFWSTSSSMNKWIDETMIKTARFQYAIQTKKNRNRIIIGVLFSRNYFLLIKIILSIN